MSKTEASKMTADIRISVNGEARALVAGETLARLLQRLGLEGGKVAVERNRAIAPRSQFSQIVLEDGDEIEIVRFVGGG